MSSNHGSLGKVMLLFVCSLQSLRCLLGGGGAGRADVKSKSGDESVISLVLQVRYYKCDYFFVNIYEYL